MLEMIERTREQIVKIRLGMVRFYGGFQQLAAIRGDQRACVIPAETLTPMADANFPQGMKVTIPSTGERDFPSEKKVDLSGERTFGPASPFGHGFDQSVLF